MCIRDRAALGATGTATLANLAALLCYYLMGCAAIAIGVFLSSLTENQDVYKRQLLYCAVILPCLVYLNQSLLKCQSLCQCLPKLYTPQ